MKGSGNIKNKSGINLKLIRSVRKKKEITQLEMANALGLNGVAAYSRRENGTYKFQVSELPILSEMLDEPIEKILQSDLQKKQLKKVVR